MSNHFDRNTLKLTYTCDTRLPTCTHLCPKENPGFTLNVYFSNQGPGMTTPQRVMRRRMMPCILEDTISTSGTSAQKMVPPAATPSASPTHIGLRWTRSGTSIPDSSVHCSSAKQVSGGRKSCLMIIYSQRGKLN